MKHKQKLEISCNVFAFLAQAPHYPVMIPNFFFFPMHRSDNFTIKESTSISPPQPHAKSNPSPRFIFT